MHFLASQPTKRVFASAILERVFFLCPNCQRLSHRLVVRSLDLSSSQGDIARLSEVNQPE